MCALAKDDHSETSPIEMAPDKVMDAIFSQGVEVLKLVQGAKLHHIQAVWGDQICQVKSQINKAG